MPKTRCGHLVQGDGFTDRCVLLKLRTSDPCTCSSSQAHDRPKKWTPTRAGKLASANDLRN